MSKNVNHPISEHPLMAAQWDHEANTVPMDGISIYSRSPAHWRCPKCAFKWIDKPYNRQKTRCLCPHCETHQLVIPGIDDILTLHPAIAESFISDENKNINLSTLSPHSQRKLLWRCQQCGIQFRDQVDRFIRRNFICTQCSNTLNKIKSGINDVVTKYPQIIEWFDQRKNPSIDLTTLSSSSLKKVTWTCPKCNYSWSSTVKARTLSKWQCPCCDLNLAIKPGYNDVLTKVPEIAAWIDTCKNDGLDLQLLGVTSDTLIWFKCPQCNNSFQSSLANRIEKNTEDNSYRVCNCIKCYQDRRKKAVSTAPSLVKFWDYKRNKDLLNLDVNLVPVTYKEQVYWHCEQCGYTWKATPNNRYRNGSTECPACESGKVIRKGVNDILTVVPDALEILDFNENERLGINIYTLGIGSTVQLHWKCKKCGNKWINTIHNLVYRDKDGQYHIGACQTCSSKGRRMFSYATEFPELVMLYNEKMNSRSLDSINGTERNTMLLWWICPTCGGQFQSTVGRMIRGLNNETKGCPYCSKQKYHDSQESFADVHPELMDEYSPSNTIDPYRVYPNSLIKVEWICRNNPTHTWSASFTARHNGYFNCPICYTSKTNTIPGINSFEDIYPDLLSYWSQHNERTPSDVRFDLRDRILWICPRCKGEYFKIVLDFVSNPDDCPYCNDRKPLPGFNTLAVKYPELAAMWASDNYTDADHVLPSSSLKAKWKCPECSGIYYASPKDIIAGDVSCPYCNDRKPLPGYNTFAVRHPDSLVDWDYVNNYVLADPDQILPTSTTKVWWTCHNDPSHHYPQRVCDRVMFDKRHRESCPYCKGRRVKKRHFV